MEGAGTGDSGTVDVSCGGRGPRVSPLRDAPLAVGMRAAGRAFYCGARARLAPLWPPPSWPAASSSGSDAMTDSPSALTALSPLDGRYRREGRAARAHLQRIRPRSAPACEVEVAWLLALSDEPSIAGVAPFGARRARGARRPRAPASPPADAARVKAIERTTNHDVKAVEYWLKERFAGIPGHRARRRVHSFRLHVRGHQQPGLRAHAARGARDDVLLPALRDIAAALKALAHAHAGRADAVAHARPARDAHHARQGDGQRLRAPRAPDRRDRARAAQGQGERRRRQLQRARRRLPRRRLGAPRGQGGRRPRPRVQSLHDADRAARLHGGALRRHRARQHRADRSRSRRRGATSRSATSGRG